MIRHQWKWTFLSVRAYSSARFRPIYKMNVVYLRQLPGDPQLQINLRYKNSECGIDREFNFSRNTEEAVSVWLARFKNNFQKELEKKISRKRKKKKVSEQDHATEGNCPSTSEALPEVDVQLLKNHESLSEITFAELLASKTYSDIKLKILDDEYVVSYNAPWVVNLSLPSSILAGFLVYPSKLDLKFANKADSHFAWFRGKMPKSKNDSLINWEPAGEGIIYNSQTDDIGFHLKLECTPCDGNVSGVKFEYVSKCEVQAGPGTCPFQHRHMFTPQNLSGNVFRVVSYNILADLYADSDYTRKELFPYCPPYALSIDYRKQLFLKEIIGYKSDIVCLQEVDGKIFDLDMLQIFDLHNYDGTFQMKGTSGEGLATFFNRNRFQLIEKYGINIGENIPMNPVFESLWRKIKDNQKLMQRIVDRSTALQITLLKSKENDNFLLVANTHLYFAPDADHIRLLQIGFSMQYVQHLYERAIEENKMKKENLSIIFCGDFNSIPQCGIYKLLTEKFVPEDFVDWWSNSEEAVKGVTLSQPFDIESACGCPKYTNFTPNFADCLDYIFYQTDNLLIDQVIPFPSDEELRAYTAIPSVVFPSDHIALVADLKWKH